MARLPIAAPCASTALAPTGSLRGRSKRYCAPLRRPSPLLPDRRSEGRNLARRWDRVAQCSVPTRHAHYPGERPRTHWSVAHATSNGLSCYSARSALTTSPSRPARASHVLQFVGWETTHSAPLSRGLQPVSYLPRCLGSYWGEPPIPPGRLCTGKSTATFSRRAE
jgi:hypothetical protein